MSNPEPIRRHCWHSAQQRRAIEAPSPYHIPVEVWHAWYRLDDGREVEVTEVTDGDRPNFEDVRYLGVGVYSCHKPA